MMIHYFYDDVGNPAKSAKNFNIRTFAIGVGEADESELKLIATPPFRYATQFQENYVFLDLSQVR